MVRSLALAYGVQVVDPADVLKAASLSGRTVQSVDIKKLVKSKAPVPDSIMAALLAERVAARECVQQGWAIDNFPSTESQNSAMAAAGFAPARMVFLRQEEEVCVDRCASRRQDQDTGVEYNLRTDPPTDPSARLLINPDDVEDAVRSAYADSHDHLEGVARGVACARVFDSSQREMTVLEQIRAFIDSPLPLQTPNSWS